MGTLYIVATPIGNLGDITTRAIDTLKSVDIIAAEDTRVTIKLLNHFNIKTKMISYHKFNEEKRSSEIIAKLNQGLDIALVTDAGTPVISDPGFIIVKSAREQGISVIGIPGASALINALALSGINSETFSFYGFLSRDNSKLKKQLQEIKKAKINTFVFYESPKRIVKLVTFLADIFPDSLISIASDMTKKFERNFYGLTKEVLTIIQNDEKIEKGEYVIVFQKRSIAETKEELFCLEAHIINTMIINNFTLKETITYLSEKGFKKNDLYSAGLRLKRINFK